MARISFKGMLEYEQALKRLQSAAEQGEMLDRAVKEGAGIVADAIRHNLDALPTEPYRKLQGGESFACIPAGQKRDLVDSFGLTPISEDKNGFVHTKAGFDGYGSFPTKQYPHGIPNQLLARSVESGSSVRKKHPFVRPAVNATRKQAVEAMQEVIDTEIKKLMK